MNKEVLAKFLELLGCFEIDIEQPHINSVTKETVIGKTISELSNVSNFKGIAIFDLDKSKDEWRIWEDVFISEFIKEFPEYRNAIVEEFNDFYGETVLRIRKQK